MIREALAKVRLATGSCPCKPSAGAKTYQNVLSSTKYAVVGRNVACLQEWDADRRQAAHAEKSLAVRELVRLSLRVQSTGVVAELHLDTALVAPSGSGADHERRIRRGCQATDGRADNWRGVLNNARACSTAARRSLRPRLSLCALPFAAAFPKATLALDASWHREGPPKRKYACTLCVECLPLLRSNTLNF